MGVIGVYIFLASSFVITLNLVNTVKLVILAAIIFNILVKSGEIMCLKWTFNLTDFLTCTCVNQLLIIKLTGY